MARCRNTLLPRLFLLVRVTRSPALRSRVCLTCMHNHFLQSSRTHKQTNPPAHRYTEQQPSCLNRSSTGSYRHATPPAPERAREATGRPADRKSFRKRRVKAMTMILKTRDRAGRDGAGRGRSTREAITRGRSGNVPAAKQCEAEQSKPD